MTEYIVKQGDCISSIAKKKGLFWEKMWDHPNNSQLKEKRKDPNILYPGDIVFVPDKEEREELGATEQRHRFRKKGVPSKLRIVLEDENDEPLVNMPYVLEIDGEQFSGATDDNGLLEQSISPEAKKGKLYVGKEKNIEYSLRLGKIDPLVEVSGVQSRLNNIGFSCGSVNGCLNTDTKIAIRKFQHHYGLEESGEIDRNTRDKLKEIYGC